MARWWTRRPCGFCRIRLTVQRSARVPDGYRVFNYRVCAEGKHMAHLVQQITSLYEAERPRVSDKIYAAAEIPLSYESITPEWLTAVLCRKHPGAEVVGHRLGPRDEGSSNRRKIHIHYNDIGQRA